MTRDDDERRRTRNPVMMTAAVLAWLGFLFLLLPNLVVVPMSFGNSHALVFPPKTYSFALYHEFFYSGDWMRPLGTSLRVAAGSTALALVIGVPAAYSLVRGAYPGKRLLAIFLLSPILVPIVVIALGLYFYFAQLSILGSIWSLIVGHAVYTTPFVVITVAAGLRHVDANLERAAAVMGAGPLTCFWRVALPLIRPTIFVAALFAFLMSMDEVVIAYFITPGATETLPVKMFSTIHWETPPVLAAISTVLSTISLVACLLGAAVQRKR